MLVALLIFAYLLALGYVYGLMWEEAMARLARRWAVWRPLVPALGGGGLVQAYWPALVGVAVLAWLAGLLSLFVPLSWGANALLVLLAAAFAWRRRPLLAARWAQVRQALAQAGPLGWLPVGLLLLWAWVLAVKVPFCPDTYLYHAQAIRWAEEYAIVPGLGNLHSRFAFNSAFFPLSALFSFAFVGLRSFHLVNAFLVLLFLLGNGLWLAQAWRQRSGLLLFPLLMLYGAAHFHDWFSSPTPDVAAYLLVCWALQAALLPQNSNAEADKNGFPLGAVLPLVMAAVSVKLSVLPLGLLLLWGAWQAAPRGGRPALLGLVAVLCGLWLLPWLVRGFVLSGYVLYPLTALNLFDVPWKVPAAQGLADQAAIRSWARFAQPGDHALLIQLSWRTWLPDWFTQKPLPDQILLLLCAASPLLALLGGLRGGAGRSTVRPLWGVAWLALCFWFWQAPDVRFGYAFMVFAAAGGLYLALGNAWAAKLRHLWLALVLLAFAFYPLYFSMLAWQRGEVRLSIDWLMPRDYYRVSTRQETLPKGQTLHIATQNYECGYAPLPCAPQPVPGLRYQAGRFYTEEKR